MARSKRKELELVGRDRARQTRDRLGLGRGPIANIDEIIENEGIILLTYPNKNEKNKPHAFFAQIDDYSVIYINSKEPLGRQNFSKIHEYCHFLYDKNSLKAVICDPGNNSKEEDDLERIADAFASEFLMPREGLEKAFYVVTQGKSFITSRHIIHMQQHFKVSYHAMLYSLLNAELIHPPTYGKLNKLEIEEIIFETKKLNYDNSLNKETTPRFPRSFYEAVVENYESRKISFGKLESLLELAEKLPEDLNLYKHEY